MPKSQSHLPRVTSVFVKFAEVPEGVVVFSSSDAGVLRMRQQVFPSYEAGCEAMSEKLGHRSHPPSALICELVH